MRSLPLEAEHELLGARFGEVAGWRLPLDYGDAANEQRATRSSAGVVDWSARGKLWVAGPEALPFLDNLLTNDLEPLRDGEGVHAALLDHHGHVVGDLAVYRVGGEFLLETDAEAAGTVFDSLSHHLVSDDAAIIDAMSHLALLGMFGPATLPALRELIGAEPPLRPYEHMPATIGGVGVRIARSSYFGGDGFEIWFPYGAPPHAEWRERVLEKASALGMPVAGAEATLVWREIVRAGAVPFGRAAEEALRIEAGRPRSQVDMDERTLAIEARLEPAISMTKGCYLGQEVVTRIVQQGHVNRLLVGFAMEGEAVPEPGTDVLAAGAAVGHVTSAAHSARLGRTIALGYVRRESAAPGTDVTVAGDPPIAARVASLPFVP